MASNNPSTSSLKPHVSMPRRNSLRLPHHPPSTPIPPSLRQSPYLNAPMFKREISTPNFPTEEDEKWLQDTVPIPSTNNDPARNSGSAKAHSDRRGSVNQSNSRHFTTPAFAVTSPYLEVPSSPYVASGRPRAQMDKYLAHSLAPPPSYGGCPLASSGCVPKPAPLNQTQSESSVPRRSTNADQSYFPRVPPMR